MVRDERGQSLIEFALILPILILLVSGIFDFGRVMYTYMNLHMVTQESVRLGGLGKSDLEISQFARDKFRMGDAKNLQVKIAPSQTYRKSGDYVTVTLEYPVPYATPMISAIFSPSYKVVTDSTIRVE